MIEPHKDVAPGLNRAPGVVTHASYLGVSTQYIVTLADGHRVTVFEQNVERATKAELWTAGRAGRPRLVARSLLRRGGDR